MLIYNFQKEFIGMDEQDLKKIGFKNLAELRAQAADFADLFIKIPGYIHNFVNTHWIDFIIYDSLKKEFKVLIHANNKYYKAMLEIKTIYLIDNPSRPAYLVNLLTPTAVPTDELDKLLKDVQHLPEPEKSTTKKALFEGQNLEKEPLIQPPEVAISNALLELGREVEVIEPIIVEIPKVPEIPKVQIKTIPEEKKAIEPKIDLILDTQDYVPEKEIKSIPTISLKVKKIEEIKVIQEEENIYIYNPRIASDALGLPIDLIEEFLEDFMIQANDFRSNIYKALEEENITEAKSLAHKLKGVAANLRIEDAFEVLTVANNSTNLFEIKEHIDQFYTIMSKLSIHTVVEEIKKSPTPVSIVDDSIEGRDYDDAIFIDINKENKPQKSTNTSENQKIHAKDEAIFINPQEIASQSSGEYNKVLAAKEIGIDTEFFNELFNDYIVDSAKLLEKIQEAIKNNNPALWQNDAHKLKGMSENMRIKQATKEIDRLLATHETSTAQISIDGIRTILKQISKP